MPDCTVAFHIGAHKTASTFLKNAIQSNKNFCRDAGVKLIPPWKYRKEFMPFETLIDDGGNLVRIFKEFETQLDKFAGDARRVMISEENTLVLSKPFGVRTAAQ